MRLFILVGLAFLAGCGPRERLHKGKSASSWKAALNDPKLEVRREAVTAMGALRVRDTVPELITALKDDDEEVRARAAEALWCFGRDSRAAVPALTAALNDPSAKVRLNAAGALGEIGAEARNAVPALQAACGDRDENVRDTATEAVRRIQRKR
jgi:HEAT repeat protein